MKPFRVAGWVCALGLWVADAGLSHAAWCNVFQVCCNSCQPRVSASYFAAPAPCCPQPVCTTQYSMRCYYQPVTSYQTKTYYEPVTTYRTSYYYEPVTSYSYSCYYDPCSCSYQQVAVPTTSYRLRSQCCPVQSWVQRCCSVPVTTYQKSCYWEPTTCCSPPALPAPPCVNGNGGPPRVMPREPPVVDESREPRRPPVVREDPKAEDTRDYDRYYGPSGYKGNRLANPEPPPSVKLDRIVAAPVTRLEGQVVRGDNAPRANVRLRFVSASRLGPQYPIAANSAGRFRLTLTPGSWLVYIGRPDGGEVLHSRIDLNGNGDRRVTLVSR